MAKIDFETKNQLVSKITDELATAVFKMQDPVFLSTINPENGYYMPAFIQKQIEIDVLQFLTYTKAYSLTKAKAIIRPWVSSFIEAANIDAFGLFHNPYGKVFLFSFKRVAVEKISPDQIVVLSNNKENIILHRSATEN
jgi:hypothetical protein